MIFGALVTTLVLAFDAVILVFFSDLLTVLAAALLILLVSNDTSWPRLITKGSRIPLARASLRKSRS